MKDIPKAKAIKYIQDTLYVLSGKWKLEILGALYTGSTRFRDLSRSIPKITTRALSKELKLMEQNKLIIRLVDEDFPGVVEYKPTEYCKSLWPILELMTFWGKDHRKKISEK